jgi:hypothetical protein
MRCARGASVLPWRHLPANRVRGPSRTPRPAPATLECLEVEVCELDQAEDRLCVLEHHLAGFGQRDGSASFGPLDEPVADPLLEDRDLLADRRLREAEARGGTAERPFPRDRSQRSEVTELDAGPATEPTRGIRNAVRPARGQPPFCFPPTWVFTMIVEPATDRG